MRAGPGAGRLPMSTTRQRRRCAREAYNCCGVCLVCLAAVIAMLLLQAILYGPLIFHIYYNELPAERQRSALLGAQYLSFEPWVGGWNNRRMSLELAFLLALKTNRTLVLPPPMPAPMMQGTWGYEDFYNVSVMRRHVRVLLWNEFEALLPHLTISVSEQRNAARRRQTHCQQRQKAAAAWCERARPVRRVSRVVAWKMLNAVIPWPRQPPAELQEDFRLFSAGRPNNRLANLLAKANETILHFPQNLFGLYYQTFYYPDRADRRRYWRAVRDGLVFNDALRAAAAEAAHRLGGRGSYACVHIRRRDFAQQFASQWLSPEVIANNVGVLLSRHTYVASDEADEVWWDRLRVALSGTVRQLSRQDRLRKVLEARRGGAVPLEWLGVVEQLVCAQAKVFVGTTYSTFSAYITRLRGYDPAVGNKQCYFTDTKYQQRNAGPGWTNLCRLPPPGTVLGVLGRRVTAAAPA
eukprot:TRINITY_DN36923_c0_g1_i1.p1 TRINITY_DN36923_c0_g1~~TRINITY_DN36923_c0_g1_i1.p1  ORF type:complete len:527 (+),score=102.46 TRINITY_DN36923_c0_g1_i1:186-1583(+)